MLSWFRTRFKEALHREKQSNPVWLRQDRDAVIEETATSLHQFLTRMCLIIADKQAFRSGQVWAIFLDGLRNIIRQARVDMDE